jgi:hypothetical protein
MGFLDLGNLEPRFEEVVVRNWNWNWNWNWAQGFAKRRRSQWG